MPGVTVSQSGHTIGVDTGHTGVTVMETGHTCVFPHEYIVDGSSSLSESVSSSFIAQHRHACSAMLIATSNHANTHPAESTSHRARNTSPHTHSSPAIVGFSIDNLKMPYEHSVVDPTTGTATQHGGSLSDSAASVIQYMVMRYGMPALRAHLERLRRTSWGGTGAS